MNNNLLRRLQRVTKADITPAAGDSNGNYAETANDLPTKAMNGYSHTSASDSKKCYKCNQDGHMSRDCPNPSSDQSKKCFKCNQDGHMSRDCPNPSSDQSRKCFKCNQDGHMSRDCPNPSSDQLKKCFKCNQDGHMSRDCPNPSSDQSRKCYKCNQDGHMSRDCPNPSSEQSKKCFKCNEDGHMSRDCPSGGDGDGPKKCFKCDEEGHFSRECPNAASGNPQKCFHCNEVGHTSRECPTADPNRPPAQNFMPPEVDLQETKKFMNRGIRYENYDKIQVRIEGGDHPDPISTFKDANLHPAVQRNVEKLQFDRPTPVQKGAIPIIHAGRDLIGCAQTGSGKTAAFLLPIISNILKTKDEIGDAAPTTRNTVAAPRVVVLAPTRELVVQTHSHCTMFCENTGLTCSFLYGGLDVMKCRLELTKNGSRCDILFATVGRFMDYLVNRSWISLAQLRYLVLDEADRMLENDDFHKAVEQIIEMLKERQQKPQMLMFSATFPPYVRETAEKLMKDDHLFLHVGIVGAASSEVGQEIWKVTGAEKMEKLQTLIQENRERNKKIIVFCERKQTTDYLGMDYAQQFPEGDKTIVTLHGSRTQEQRHFVMQDFKRMEGFGIMFATSCAARGLDIPSVDLVVNYDLPSDIDTYIHRIGRTGRCGLPGRSVSFYEPIKDGPLAGLLMKVLSDAQQPVPDWLADEAAMAGTVSERTSYRTGPRRKETVYEVPFDAQN